MLTHNNLDSLEVPLLPKNGTEAAAEEKDVTLPEQKTLNEANLGDVINQIKIEELEKYVRDYVFEGKNFRLSKIEITLRVATALVGAGWGIPWRNAAASAAVIFPIGPARQVFEIIFAGGIVVTVGGDGLWIMLEIGNQIGSKSLEEKALIQKQKTAYVRITEVAFPALFALFSCIPAVYASVKYNTGPQQLLGLLTLVDNYAYGLYGYSKLTKNFNENIVNPRSDPDYKQLLAIRDGSVNKVNSIINGNVTKPNNLDDFMKFLFSPEEIEEVAALNQNSRGKKTFKLLTTTMVAISSSLVGIFLTKEFLESKILDNAGFAIAVAILAEIPTFIVTCVSTENIFGRLIDTLLCHASNESRRALVKEIYPIASLVIPALIFPISLTAPTAGGFITYNTFGQEETGDILQWGATASIIAARIVFSNFTLNRLTEEFLLKVYEMRHTKKDPINERIQLRKFADVLGKTNLKLFKPFLQPSNNNGNQSEQKSEDSKRADDDDEISQTTVLINRDAERSEENDVNQRSFCRFM